MNKQYILLTLVLVALLWPVCAFAEQAKPSLAQAKATYEQNDRDLNKAYKSVKAELPEHTFAELKAKQRGWIHYRDFFCDEVIRRDSPRLAKADLTKEVVYWQRMSGITHERTAILRAILSAHQGKEKPLTGRWIDGYGGYLNIVEQGDKIAFEIDVVRGPTYHLGNLAGVAERNGQLIRFNDGGEDDGKGYVRKPAWVTFIHRANHIELITAGAQIYCGARAYFDNDYYRVGDLTEKARKQVLKQAGGEPDEAR
ncbi:MAG: lysozyme inhibitor LprI family protein [Phycisphaeraceae bacterium]